MMLQKMASIDAQMRLLVPKRVSEDDKLIEYDALLLDRFLDVLEDLHGKELKDKVNCWNFGRKRLICNSVFCFVLCVRFSERRHSIEQVHLRAIEMNALSLSIMV